MKLADQISMFGKIAGMIFQSKIVGSDITQVKIQTNTGVFPGRYFGNGLRGYDFTFNPGRKVVSLRILEQNPDKTDKYNNLTTYAILARQGKKIAWIIRRDTNEFIGRLTESDKEGEAGVFEFTKSTPRALTTMKFANGGYIKENVMATDQFNQEYQQYDNGDFITDLPEIDPDDIGIYVTGI